MYNVTEDGRFWCPQCITTHVWDFELEECVTCDTLFPNCDGKCDIEGCYECEEDYVLGEDGFCYEEYSYCEEHAWYDDYGVYCSQCDEGLFFIAYALDEDQDEPEPGCIDCDDEAWGIEYCDECSTVILEENELITRVCDKCEGGYTPSPSQYRCIPKIEFSEIDLEDQELSENDLFVTSS